MQISQTIGGFRFIVFVDNVEVQYENNKFNIRARMLNSFHNENCFVRLKTVLMSIFNIKNIMH